MKKLVRITTVPISLNKLLGPQLEFMDNHFNVIAVSADEEKLREVASKYKVDYHHVEMTREITPLQDLKALWNLYRFLKREKPAIVHTHTPKAGTVGMLAAKLAGVPHRLHTVAGMPLMETSGFKRKVLDFVEKITYAAATKLYPNSKGLCDFIRDNRYTHDEKLKVIANGSSNGIDTTYFSPEAIKEEQSQKNRQRLGLKGTDFVFVFVGRLVGDKGINELVTAFKQLETDAREAADNGRHKEKYCDCALCYSSNNAKLLLVGPLETELDPLSPETLAEIEYNPNILTVGYQSDVRQFLAISNALVFPSYREGFPNVVMQAGAMQLPAIVTDINGCNEIIIEGNNGTIIPVKDAVALKTAMYRMLADCKWRINLQFNSREMITSRYEQKVVWKALLQEYKSLIHLNNKN
ncbi:glycosyltransferase family 4 protein [Marnyiella aurantia]|uniref:Glycosyltransferase family 4 protein n=1 Tax=Marnyiella aurantia TaxID=2758037 RepID=A0A7D7LUG4_9FLAO|nr:glycosyltransferase family 4 protein [Marnyiella aurantia]MBA5247439.1 glycosyltransferase family 4 protein [Marnyiella aurantia]QMS99195.1 glycosyltransferase family 4 protein [Marnyiella aurantia]